MYTINPKATIKIRKRIFVSKPTKEEKNEIQKTIQLISRGGKGNKEEFGQIEKK